MTGIDKIPMLLHENLPRPQDDGSTDHLAGKSVPAFSLRSPPGEVVTSRNYRGRRLRDVHRI